MAFARKMALKWQFIRVLLYQYKPIKNYYQNLTSDKLSNHVTVKNLLIMTSYLRKFWILFAILSKKRIFYLKSYQHKKNIHIFVRYYLRYPKKALSFYSDQVFMYLRHNNVTESKSDFFCKERKKMPKNLL